MVYSVKGGGENVFEWLIEADSEKDAEKQARGSMSDDDKIKSVTILSGEESVERALEYFKDDLIRLYIEEKYGVSDVTSKEFINIKKVLSIPENYYKIIMEHNAKLRTLRVIKRVTDIDKLSFKTLKESLNKLYSAKTDEEFNNELNELKEVK